MVCWFAGSQVRLREIYAPCLGGVYVCFQYDEVDCIIHDVSRCLVHGSMMGAEDRQLFVTSRRTFGRLGKFKGYCARIDSGRKTDAV